MFCPTCGKEVADENLTYCPYCNRRLREKSNLEYYYKQPESNSIATAGFILSFFIPFIAFWLCVAGCCRANERCNGQGLGLAIAGIIICILSFIISTLFILSFLLLL